MRETAMLFYLIVQWETLLLHAVYYFLAVNTSTYSTVGFMIFYKKELRKL